MFKLTPYVLKNLTSKKATRRYPKEKRSAFENIRGELVNQIEICTFCGACSLKCPSQCISVDKKNAIWTYDPFACVYCGICVEICPVNSLYQNLEYRLPVDKPQTVCMKGELKKKKINALGKSEMR
jgi:formate hydrogenlyase subunit 6/NADH:ubiquinone oxidoreductase subunit I